MGCRDSHPEPQKPNLGATVGWGPASSLSKASRKSKKNKKKLISGQLQDEGQLAHGAKLRGKAKNAKKPNLRATMG